jgi:gliding motility-associated protein GldE
LETDPLPLAGHLLWDIQFYPFSSGMAFSILIVLLLLFFSALISGSEIAYFSLGPSDRAHLEKNRNRRNILVLKNLEHPEKLLATILVANNFVNVGIVILSSYISSNLVDFSHAPALGFFVQVVVITFFILMFGEIIPKVYATRIALKMAVFMSVPLAVLEKICRPLNFLLIYSTSFVNRRMQKYKQNISVDELSQALEMTADHEISEDKEILEGIVKFGNKSVVEIMHPRVDVVALDIKENFEEVVALINDSGYSRIPVYSGTFDHIRGILYIKDLLPHIHKGNNFKWQSIIRPPFYVPENKKIDDLLENFQKNKVHMAIVVDEYGGTSGIVTLEDILEEIVGDIADEFDDEENFFTRLSDNKYLFDGKVLLNDFYKIVGCPDDVFGDVKGEADTLAGLILELRGEFPRRSDKINCKNFVFSIEAVDHRRIKQVKVEVGKE